VHTWDCLTRYMCNHLDVVTTDLKQTPNKFKRLHVFTPNRCIPKWIVQASAVPWLDKHTDSGSHVCTWLTGTPLLNFPCSHPDACRSTSICVSFHIVCTNLMKIMEHNCFSHTCGCVYSMDYLPTLLPVSIMRVASMDVTEISRIF